MEINTIKHRVEQSGVKAHHQFMMKASAKAFQLMIASLYSNPIKAFIRELSTNAYEAHQLLGIEDTPFDVWLPTNQDLNFTIRDYGPGLSEEQVKEIYTVVFESSKETSNDFGGCFGLGSKSPFAYAGNAPFSIVSHFGGKKYSYVCYRDTDGIPCMDLLAIDESDSTGVEIKVPVKRNDIYDIHCDASQVYSWFKVKPNVKQKSYNLKYDNHEATVAIKKSDYTIHNSSSVNYIHMGNILYPISFDSLKVERCFHGIIIQAPIGSVHPTPSRETLEYNGHTVNYLSNKLEEINNTIIKELEQGIAGCNNYYEAVRLALKSVTAFPGLRVGSLSYKGKKLDSVGFTLQNGTCHSTTWKSNKIRFAASDDFTYGKDYKFFCKDSTASQIRINQYCQANGVSNIILCEKDKLRECCDELGVDESYFILTSSLPYVPPLKGVKRGSGKGHKTKVMKWKPGYSQTLAWEDCEVDLGEAEGFYVEYYNNKCKFSTDTLNDKQINPEKLTSILTMMSLPADTVVYGIKTELLKKIHDKMPNMKNLIIEAQKWVANNKPAIQQVVSSTRTLSKVSRNDINKIHNIFSKNQSLLKNSVELKGIIEHIDTLQKLCVKHNHIQDVVMTLTDKNINLYSEKEAPYDMVFVNRTRAFIDKYPLISQIYDWMDKNGTELAYYILGKGI